jgi:hypothetical protein
MSYEVSQADYVIDHAFPDMPVLSSFESIRSCHSKDLVFKWYWCSHVESQKIEKKGWKTETKTADIDKQWQKKNRRDKTVDIDRRWQALIDRQWQALVTLADKKKISERLL